MTRTNQIAAAGANAGGPERAQAVSAKNESREVEYLLVGVNSDGFQFDRKVRPFGKASVEEIRTAIRKDEDFGNPQVERGVIVVERGDEHVALASYETDDYYFVMPGFDITTMTMYFDDDSSEEMLR